MNQFFTSFTLGFLCTSCLFALCFLITIGAKTLLNLFENILPQKQPISQEVELPKPKRKRKPKTQKHSKIIRSVEIDPSEIDRIYVKKIS